MAIHRIDRIVGVEFFFWPRCQYWTAGMMTAVAASSMILWLLHRWQTGNLPRVGRASLPKFSQPFQQLRPRRASRVHCNRTLCWPLDASGSPSESAEVAAAAVFDLPPPSGGCCRRQRSLMPRCFPSSASGADRNRCGCARSRLVRPTRPRQQHPMPSCSGVVVCVPCPPGATRLSEEWCHLPGADD